MLSTRSNRRCPTRCFEKQRAFSTAMQATESGKHICSSGNVPALAHVTPHAASEEAQREGKRGMQLPYIAGFPQTAKPQPYHGEKNAAACRPARPLTFQVAQISPTTKTTDQSLVCSNTRNRVALALPCLTKYSCNPSNKPPN